MVNVHPLSKQESQKEIISWSENKQIDVQSLHEKVLRWPKTKEVDRYTILAMPLESMGFTPEQERKFLEEGGFINPEQNNIKANKNNMIYWTVSFKNLEAKIDGKLYTGFELFKKVYEAFPDICSMSQKEAEEAGLYPYIHYRNFAARKWMAEKLGGRLATLTSYGNGNSKGELQEIYNEAKGETNLKKLAAMGQAPLGWVYPCKKEIHNFGVLVKLGSDSLSNDGNVITLYVHCDTKESYSSWSGQNSAVSSVVIINK